MLLICSSAVFVFKPVVFVILFKGSCFYHRTTVRRGDLMADKKKVEYTAEQKEAVLKRAKELDNVKTAAAEAGIPWQLVSRWRKEADPTATKAAQKAKKDAAKADKPKASDKKDSKATKAKKTASKSQTASNSAKKTVTRNSAKTKAPAKTSKTAATKKNSKPAATKTTAKRTRTESKKPADQSKSVEKTNVKNLKALDMSIKKDTPASKLQIENAVLRTENKELKEQVAKLRKALQNLM